jgi:hypothetical protein
MPEITATVEAVLGPLVRDMAVDLGTLAETIRSDYAHARADLRRAGYVFRLLGPVAGHA